MKKPTLRGFVDALFARAHESLDREQYANLGDASYFNTKLAGVHL